MKYKMKYCFLVVLILSFSCKNKNETKIEKSLETKEKVRKDIDLPGLTYHSKFDNVKNEGDYEIYTGEYNSDRFYAKKKALYLDGISDFGVIENHDKIKSKDQLTISIWYKPDSYKGNGYNVIIGKPGIEGKPNTNQYAITSIGNLYPSASGTYKFFLSINGVLHYVKTKSNTLVSDNWQLLTATYNGSRMDLYVNGKLLAGKKVSGKMDVYDSNLHIGKTPYKEFYTSGGYDDLMIFDRALKKDEILKLYENR